jgi:hypothetical protein
MKNIYLIPTDQPSMLHKAFDEAFILSIFPTLTNGLYKSVPYFSYITSDEDIKEGDWWFSTIDKIIFKVTKEDVLVTSQDGIPHGFYKIILTTDPTLIADGVQEIEDTFIEWLVKNPTCEFVQVIKENICSRCYSNNTDECWSAKECSDGKYDKTKYTIIIPQEEPKTGYVKSETKFLGVEFTLKDGSKQFVPKQETLEELAYRIAYIAGANEKAEKMYSEEEVYGLLKTYQSNYSYANNEIGLKKWFEDLKKK